MASNEMTEAIVPPPATYWKFWGTLVWAVVILIVVNLFETVAILALVLWLNGGGLPESGSAIMQALITSARSGLGLSVAAIVALIAYGGLVAGIIKLKKGTVLRAYLGLEPIAPAALRNWLGLLVGLLIILELLASALGHSSTPEFMKVAYATANPVWLLWFALVVAAPLSEEIFFRGFLLKGFATSFMGPVAAVVVTSGVWALLHGQYDAYDIAMVFVLGLLLGAARLMTGSLLVPLVLHAVANLLATAEVAFFS